MKTTVKFRTIILKQGKLRTLIQLLTICLIFVSCNYFPTSYTKLGMIGSGLVMPFLWSLFFVYLFAHGYGFVFFNATVYLVLLCIAEYLNFHELGFKRVLYFASIVSSISFFSVFAYQFFGRLRRYKVAAVFSFLIAIPVYVIPLCFIIYMLSLKTIATYDALYAVLQSNIEESAEYISAFIPAEYIVLFILISTIILFSLFQQEKVEKLKINNLLLLIFLVLSFSSFVFRNPNSGVLFLAQGAYNQYNEEMELFKELQKKRQIEGIKFKAVKKEQGETYVVVIGESLNKKHMGMYGYHRNTTPLLTETQNSDSLIGFSQAYSGHTHTMNVLSMSLTESNQYNGKPYFKSLSIINILNRANVKTYWLSNQVVYGGWDNLVSILAADSDSIVSINHAVGPNTRTANYDGDLIEEFKKAVHQATTQNRVFFIHLMGSHHKYSDRYPFEKFTVYDEALKPGEFGTTASKNPDINYYDNSVIYNDYVVDAILKELKKSKGTGFIYMADHADDVIPHLGHNSAKFTFEMAQTPLMMWCSDEYKVAYPDKFKNLIKNKDKLFSNDLFFETMIGFFGIDTDRYEPANDLTSGSYDLKPQDALILHGKKNYIEKGNYIYWQQKNADFLIKEKQSSRVFPHRVNSLGKLKEIWYSGFRSFEADIVFGSRQKNTFQVGHNEGVMGLDLETFLSGTVPEEIERIWLDFKNLTPDNYQKAIERLNYLDQKFDLKGKVIVESSIKSPVFKAFGQNQWHSSYYMPTTQIIKLLEKQDASGMKTLASQIAIQIQAQDVAAVSFDSRLYPFIKNYLESKINENVVYHIWLAPDLKEADFEKKLTQNRMYQDKRVKTLLTSYHSQFNL